MFNKEMRNIIKELRTLKELRRKSPMVLKTTEIPFTLTFKMIAGGGIGIPVARQFAIIRADSARFGLAQIYFNIQSFDYRTISVTKYYDENGLFYMVDIPQSYNQSDIDKIAQGVDCYVTYNMKLVTTEVSTLSISYVTKFIPG